MYRRFYSLNLHPQDPSHYVSLLFKHSDPASQVYFDLALDGKDIGRLDFELFGNEAPKSVNNFLGFITGDFSPYMRYKNSYILSALE